MGQVINGYTITQDFTTHGAGMCRWAVATKNGEQYFIKEFLEPKYPKDGAFSEVNLRYMREQCTKFFKERSAFYDALRDSNNGNIVAPKEFFRYGTKYYLTSEYITAVGLTVAQLSKLPDDKKRLLLKVLSSSMAGVHQNGLVHSDMKLDNILIKQTSSGSYTAKIIDFDSGFRVCDPPGKDDEVVGDDVYFAPETIMFMNGEYVKLTEKIDIFALGIIFHQIWSGELPKTGAGYDSVADAVANDVWLQLHPSIPDKEAKIIRLMLNKEPTMRPPALEILAYLNGKPSSETKKTPELEKDLKLKKESDPDINKIIWIPPEIK